MQPIMDLAMAMSTWCELSTMGKTALRLPVSQWLDTGLSTCFDQCWIYFNKNIRLKHTVFVLLWCSTIPRLLSAAIQRLLSHWELIRKYLGNSGHFRTCSPYERRRGMAAPKKSRNSGTSQYLDTSRSLFHPKTDTIWMSAASRLPWRAVKSNLALIDVNSATSQCQILIQSYCSDFPPKKWSGYSSLRSLTHRSRRSSHLHTHSLSRFSQSRRARHEERITNNLQRE